MLLFKIRNRRIMVLTIFILFGLSVALLNNCEEEKTQPRSYPRVKTNPVSNITDKGAIFSADIYSLGTEQIIEHGFVWDKGDPNLNKNKILLGPCNTEGIYSAEIFTTLVKDEDYTVKSFVQTADHIIYGIPVIFKSRGSGAPVIYSFKPELAEWTDTLIVIGKNFSWVEDENVARLNQTQCTILSSTDSSLVLIVSKDVSEVLSVLSVEIAGNKAVFKQDTFRLIAPVIKSYYPLEAGWGDTIIIAGENFESKYFHNSISATFNGFPAIIAARGNESLAVIVPTRLTTVTNKVLITFNKLILTLSENLPLKPLSITSIYPKDGTWETILTLKGKFHPEKDKNIITIGGFNSDIISNYTDSLKVYVPPYLTEHNNLIVNTSEPFSVVSPDTFKLLPPKIESLTPSRGITFSEVTLTGDYLLQYFGYGCPTTVKFGSVNASILSISNTQIICTVPFPEQIGPVNVEVTVCSQSTKFKDQFDVINPIITNVTPLNGTFNDEITLEGINLVNSTTPLGVTFTSYGEYITRRDAEIISAASDKLVIKVPLNIDSIPNSLEIFAIYNKLFTYSSNYFILSPPEITSVEPAVFTTGQTLTINGRNFHPSASGNEIYWGNYQLTVISSAPDKIVVSVPGAIPAGLNKICVKTGGYKRYSPELLEHN